VTRKCDKLENEAHAWVASNGRKFPYRKHCGAEPGRSSKWELHRQIELRVSGTGAAVPRLTTRQPLHYTCRMPGSSAEVLSSIPLFRNLSARQLRKLQRSAAEDRYEAGTTIVNQGGRTTALFVVLEGSVKVVKNGRTVSRRGPGQYFGELSMIDGRPRAASVVSETPVRCLVLHQDSLRKLLMTDPQVSWAMLESLA
jgi:CRP/FNR family cyclic AMP-dependent transcriptional regulator